MNSQPSTYPISFTSGGLFFLAAIKVADLYLALQDWEAVKNQIFEGNVLQARTHSSLLRTAHELLQRMKTLNTGQLSLLVAGTRQDQQQILWLAACKQYPFAREFAMEVVREKYLRFDWNVSYADFDAFYYAKCEWRKELARITESTRKKLRQVLFLMMTQAEILSPARVIIPTVFSRPVARAIAEDDPGYFSVFPISDTDIRNSLS